MSEQRLLLDSHTLYWALDDLPKLSHHARELSCDGDQGHDLKFIQLRVETGSGFTCTFSDHELDPRSLAYLIVREYYDTRSFGSLPNLTKPRPDEPPIAER